MSSRCETCGMRLRAEKNPRSMMSRIWQWHTGWCPMWKAYQKELAQKGQIGNLLSPADTRKLRHGVSVCGCLSVYVCTHIPYG
jgi:hypothetical protein